MIFPKCGRSIIPGEQSCICGVGINEIENCISLECSRCGYFPVYVPKDGYGDCPKCGKIHS